MTTETIQTLANPPLMRAAARLSYSIEEVVGLTGLGRTTLYRLIAQGELISCKIGRRRLVRASDLDAFLDRTASAAALD